LPAVAAGAAGHPQRLAWSPAEQENQLEVVRDFADAADAPAGEAVLLQGQQGRGGVPPAPELHPAVQELGGGSGVNRGALAAAAGPRARPAVPLPYHAAAQHQQKVQEEDDFPLQAHVLPTHVLRGKGKSAGPRASPAPSCAGSPTAQGTRCRGAAPWVLLEQGHPCPIPPAASTHATTDPLPSRRRSEPTRPRQRWAVAGAR